jgi:hypothetical protein
MREKYLEIILLESTKRLRISIDIRSLFVDKRIISKYFSDHQK